MDHTNILEALLITWLGWSLNIKMAAAAEGGLRPNALERLLQSLCFGDHRIQTFQIKLKQLEKLKGDRESTRPSEGPKV